MHSNMSLQMDDGVHLNINMWKEQGNPKGLILILHGMAEHSVRYEEFASFLTSKGYIVYAYDHRGHGGTGKKVGKMGFFMETDGWERVVKDIHTLTKWIKNRHKDLELILLGHSMGSIFARTCIQTFGHEFIGVILSGTTLGGSYVKRMTGQWITGRAIKKQGLYKEAKKIDKLTFGSYNKQFSPTKTAFDWLSRDAEKVKEYVEDDLCGFICSTSFFRDLLKGCQLTSTKERIENIPKSLPILLFSGDKDPVSRGGKDVKKLYEMYKKADIKNVSLKLYKDGRHEMLNELNRQEVYDDVLGWMNQYCTKGVKDLVG